MFIARAKDPPIIRYNPQDQSTETFNFDGSAQSISADEYSNSIYWANYISATDRFEIMKTSYSGETMQLNISYSGEIRVATDENILYVLDKDNMRIDKYLKNSLEQHGNMTFSNEVVDFVIGYGKSWYLAARSNK